MSGSEITTRHMLFSLVVNLLSATGHDFTFRPTITYAEYRVNGFRL
jgi:hypothetical protein